MKVIVDTKIYKILRFSYTVDSVNGENVTHGCNGKDVVNTWDLMQYLIRQLNRAHGYFMHDGFDHPTCRTTHICEKGVTNVYVVINTGAFKRFQSNNRSKIYTAYSFDRDSNPNGNMYSWDESHTIVEFTNIAKSAVDKMCFCMTDKERHLSELHSLPPYICLYLSEYNRQPKKTIDCVTRFAKDTATEDHPISICLKYISGSITNDLPYGNTCFSADRSISEIYRMCFTIMLTQFNRAYNERPILLVYTDSSKTSWVKRFLTVLAKRLNSVKCLGYRLNIGVPTESDVRSLDTSVIWIAGSLDFDTECTRRHSAFMLKRFPYFYFGEDELEVDPWSISVLDFIVASEAAILNKYGFLPLPEKRIVPMSYCNNKSDDIFFLCLIRELISLTHKSFLGSHESRITLYLSCLTRMSDAEDVDKMYTVISTMEERAITVVGYSVLTTLLTGCCYDEYGNAVTSEELYAIRTRWQPAQLPHVYRLSGFGDLFGYVVGRVLWQDFCHSRAAIHELETGEAKTVLIYLNRECLHRPFGIMQKWSSDIRDICIQKNLVFNGAYIFSYAFLKRGTSQHSAIQKEITYNLFLVLANIYQIIRPVDKTVALPSHITETLGKYSAHRNKFYSMQTVMS